MTGTLHKSKDKWLVIYGSDPNMSEVWPIDLPLHPDDVKSIEDDALVFDNVESRIFAFRRVEFDIIEECPHYSGKHMSTDCSCKSGFIKYAKLKHND
jgi:hypothetical protein